MRPADPPPQPAHAAQPPISEVVWCPSKDGHLRYAHHLADAIAALRHTPGIAVLTTCPVEPAYRDLAYPMHCVGRQIRDRASFATPLHWALDRIGYRLTLERRLLDWVRRHPDCRTVHLQEAHLLTAPFTASTLRRLGRRVVYTMHNVAPHVKRGRFATWLHRRLTRAFLLRTDALIVHADSLRDALAATFRIDPARIHVVPHGVWQAEPAAGESSPGMPGAGASARCTSAGGAPGTHATPAQARTADGTARARLLFYGTIRANKGLHHLLDAFADAPAHWQLTVAGRIDEPGYVETEIAPRVTKLRAAGRAIDYRPGFVPDAQVPALFASTDLLVLPYDGFLAQSGVLFDAIAWRVPVVATPSGALGDTVRASGIGVVSRSPSPADLLDALKRGLAIDPVHLTDAWTRVRDQNSWPRAADLTLGVYQSMYLSVTR